VSKSYMKDMPNLQGARCREVGPDMMFVFDEAQPIRGHIATSRNRHLSASLRAMCASCPVLYPCLEWAMPNENYGWWGGLSAQEREMVRRRGVAADAVVYALERLLDMGADPDITRLLERDAA